MRAFYHFLLFLRSAALSLEYSLLSLLDSSVPPSLPFKLLISSPFSLSSFLPSPTIYSPILLLCFPCHLSSFFYHYLLLSSSTSLTLSSAVFSLSLLSSITTIFYHLLSLVPSTLIPFLLLSVPPPIISFLLLTLPSPIISFLLLSHPSRLISFLLLSLPPTLAFFYSHFLLLSHPSTLYSFYYRFLLLSLPGGMLDPSCFECSGAVSMPPFRVTFNPRNFSPFTAGADPIWRKYRILQYVLFHLICQLLFLNYYSDFSYLFTLM